MTACPSLKVFPYNMPLQKCDGHFPGIEKGEIADFSYVTFDNSCLLMSIFFLP